LWINILIHSKLVRSGQHLISLDKKEKEKDLLHELAQGTILRA